LRHERRTKGTANEDAYYGKPREDFAKTTELPIRKVERKNGSKWERKVEK